MGAKSLRKRWRSVWRTISDHDLQTYAMNDMRNNAAKMGATNILIHNNQLGGGVWSNTQSQISGTAYKCSHPKRS